MDKEATLDNVETVLDVVEEVVEEAERGASKLGRFLHSPKLWIGVSLVAVSAGSAYAGYKYAEKKMELRIDQIVEEEVEKTRIHYSRIYKTSEEYADPEKVLQDLHGEGEVEAARAESRKRGERKRTNYNAISTDIREDDVVVKEDPTKDPDMPPEEDEEDRALEASARERAGTRQRDDAVVVINDGDEIEVTPLDFDYEKEVPNRTPLEPYIITEDEYHADELHHEHIDLTYFSADDKLIDDQEDLILNVDHVVGSDNLTRFGYGSRDVDTVYIRNEMRQIDYEVTRSNGSYAYEVLGQEAELRHSATRPGVRKFRDRDD